MKLRLFCFGIFLFSDLVTPFAQTAAPPVNSGQTHEAMATHDSSRSLNATFLWIKRQMKSSGSSHDVSRADRGLKWHRVTSYDNLQLNNCELTIEQSSVSYGRQRQLLYTIPLGDLATATYQVDEGNVQFKYTPAVLALFLRSHTKSMHWGRTGQEVPGKENVATDVVELEFGSVPSFGPDKIKELGNAFMHMADLCAAQAPLAPANK
jgi:hypothetical protein